MALHIEMEARSGLIIARERLFETADRTRLVPQDDPDAAFLFCTPGAPIGKDDAQRFGIGADVDGMAEVKEKKPQSTKEKKAQSTK